MALSISDSEKVVYILVESLGEKRAISLIHRLMVEVKGNKSWKETLGWVEKLLVQQQTAQTPA